MKLTACIPILSLFLVSCTSNKSTDNNQPPSEDRSKLVDTIVRQQPVDTVKTPDTTSIGELTLGMKGKEILAILGEPSSKSKAEEWGADGLLHQDWNYSGKGLTLNVNIDNKHKDMELFSIMVTRPCSFLTDQKIGIGSSHADVMKAYEKQIDKASSDATMIIVGSVYGGMIFNFKGNKVEKIFIGAAAE